MLPFSGEFCHSQKIVLQFLADMHELLCTSLY